jgi:hypothetical protein
MKAKMLSFIFIYFSESGLFKGLRPKKLKNSPVHKSRAGLWPNQSQPVLLARGFSSPSIIALISV